MLVAKPSDGTPWICLGDFNLIYQVVDKNNRNLNRMLMGCFRNTLDACNLLEIVLQNRKYTWSNERESPTLVHLDRVFCNPDWETCFPLASLQALSSSISDHCPLFLSQSDDLPWPASFKFEQFWIRVPGFLEIVKEAWDMLVQGNSAMMKLHNKFINTAKKLRTWSQSLFGDAKIQLYKANDIILQLDIAQESRALSQEELELRRALKIRILGLAAVERSRRCQCSRITWLREGDATTKFFHLYANARNRKKKVSCLQKEDGKTVWAHSEKEHELFSHFHSILGTKERRSHTMNWQELNLPKIEDNSMDVMFTEEEILAAIQQQPNSKAPGPDGFTADFYKACWPVIKEDIIASCICLHNLQTGPPRKTKLCLSGSSTEKRGCTNYQRLSPNQSHTFFCKTDFQDFGHENAKTHRLFNLFLTKCLHQKMVYSR